MSDIKDLIPLIEPLLRVATALQNHLQAVINTLANNKGRDVNSSIGQITKLLNTLPRFSKPEQEWLRKIDNDNAISADRLENLRHTTLRQYGDDKAVIADVQEWISSLSNTITTLATFQRGLSKEEIEMQRSVAASDALLVGFLAGRSLKHFSAGLDAWSSITQVFGRLVGSTDDNLVIDMRGLRIHVALKSSLIETLAAATDSLLVIIEDSVHRERMRELLRRVATKANPALSDIDDLVQLQLDESRREQIEPILDTLLARHDKTGDNEMRNLLRSTLEKITRHLEEGGSVGFSMKSKPPTEAVGRINQRFELALDGASGKALKALTAGPE